MEGWRLGYEDCSKVNPGIIYCSISGFGRQGPMSDLPAFDPIVQAATATMASNGYPDTPPTRMGISFGDTVPALYAVIGILAALHQRHETGRGGRIDISMADALVAMLMIEPLEAQLEWGFPLRAGSRIPRLVPCNVYRCRDGYVALNAAPPRQWERLVAALSIPELKDPALVPLAARIRRGDWVDAMVSSWVAERSCAEVLRLTREHGVPCAKVVETLNELLADGHFQDRGMIQPVEHPTLGCLPDLYAPGVPIFLDGAAPAQLAPARLVGADTRPILRQLLGLTDEELDRLEQQGIV
jgi:crotonobetainyl-CoA:carnitine CoA-transferase CaiB-like acyl-CoA transferase